MRELLGVLFTFIGLLVLGVIAPIQLLRRKSGVLKVGVAGGVSIALGFIAFATTPQKPEKLPTTAEWKKHREYVVSMTRWAFISDGPYKMYETAGKVLDDEYLKECKFGGCSGAIHVLRALRAATESGVITPKGAESIRGWEPDMLSALNEREKEIRKNAGTASVGK